MALRKKKDSSVRSKKRTSTLLARLAEHSAKRAAKRGKKQGGKRAAKPRVKRRATSSAKQTAKQNSTRNTKAPAKSATTVTRSSSAAKRPASQFGPALRLNDGYAHTSPDLADEVKELQALLVKAGAALRPDGRFGPRTEECVKEFQHAHGLDDDGVVGPRTWAALMAAPAPDVRSVFETTRPRNAVSLEAEHKEAAKYRASIEKGAKAGGVPPSIICAIGSRESRWGLALKPKGPAGTGDFAARPTLRAGRTGPMPPDGGGFGRGLMQIDYDAHEFARTGDWKDAEANILYGCSVLKSNLALLKKRTKTKGQELLRLAVAAYNCGAGNVLKALEQGKDVDYFTAHRDYSRDVLDRAGWFQLKGWA